MMSRLLMALAFFVLVAIAGTGPGAVVASVNPTREVAAGDPPAPQAAGPAFVVFTDNETGCEYLVSPTGAITPRLGKGGLPRCAP